MGKRFIIILAVIFVFFAGFVFISKRNNSTSNISDGEGIVSQNLMGAGNKGVVLVEYGDFQCPACAAYFPIIKQLKSDFGDDITFQFRHFPLVSIHQNAMAAHRAAEAAAKQDKFWEMHDLLYERQNVWVNTPNPTAIFEVYAAELGLDMEQYLQDYSSSLVNDIINADVRSAQALGATSTPTFVLNDERLAELPNSYDDFKSLIEDAIKQQNDQ